MKKAIILVFAVLLSYSIFAQKRKITTQKENLVSASIEGKWYNNDRQAEVSFTKNDTSSSIYLLIRFLIKKHSA